MADPTQKKPGPRPKRPEDRFWVKVDKNGPVPIYRPELGPCWLWTRAINYYGYGVFYIGGRVIGAHIFAWTLDHGPVPPGKEIDHLCRVRPCVRHLEAVTHLTNVRRGEQAQRTHCIHDHEFTPKNTYITPEGRRFCRACAAHRARERYQRLKA